MALLKTYPYSDYGLNEMEKWQYGQNWPVVYIIHNDKEAYVGETLDITRRTAQHLQERNLDCLDTIEVVTSKMFNKSSIIDLESFLIKYMSADGLFTLKNGNAGISNHNYFNKDIYLDSFIEIWEQLKTKGLVNNTIQSIENSNLFKYSPYKALGREQKETAERILQLIADYQPGEKLTIVVNGCAGTGKTILAVYLMKLIMDINNNQRKLYDVYDYDNDYSVEINHAVKKDRLGIVIPQKALAATFVEVFKSIDGLSKDLVIRPKDVYKKKYDLLIVDEAHRLQRQKSLGLGYKGHKQINEKLNLGDEGTQLDWIIKCSDIQLLFYDSFQSIRPSDIEPHQFLSILKKYDCRVVQLQMDTQFRCRAGNDYIQYVHSILHSDGSLQRREFTGYDLRLLKNMRDLWNTISEREKEYGLSRVVSGIGWDNSVIDNQNYYYVNIEGTEYRFRKTALNWVADPRSKTEIGDIHKIQGYDLCYAGVIFGPEIDYDNESKSIVIDKKHYFDRVGKQDTTDEELTTYVLNIYKTLMTRGIYGTYVYAVNKGMRDYLKKWF